MEKSIQQRNESMLTFERANVQGAAAIMEKFSVCDTPIGSRAQLCDKKI